MTVTQSPRQDSMGRLTDKVALVTGGTRGIGAAIGRGWSCHCGGSTGRAGRIPSCSQGRHPPERSAVAHGSGPERQERHSLTAASRSR